MEYYATPEDELAAELAALTPDQRAQVLAYESARNLVAAAPTGPRGDYVPSPELESAARLLDTLAQLDFMESVRQIVAPFGFTIERARADIECSVCMQGIYAGNWYAAKGDASLCDACASDIDSLA